MGCCSSINCVSSIVINVPLNTCYSSENLQALKSSEIEDELNVLQKYLKYEIKLLLLGAAEAGKSTILKQVRMNCFFSKLKIQPNSLSYDNIVL